MSLKTRLRISIVTLVTLLVFAQCVVSLRTTAEANFSDALDRAQTVAGQVRHLVLQRVNERAATVRPPPPGLEETKALWVQLVEHDKALASLLEKTMATSTAVVEILVCDEDGRILSASSPTRTRLTYASVPDLNEWKTRPVWDRLAEVLTQRKEYAIIVPLGVAGRIKPVLTIRVVLSSVLLRDAIMPHVRSLLAVSLLSLLASMIIAALFSNVVLRFLERLAQRIDLIASGQFSPEAGAPAHESKEIAAVLSKLDLLSEQFRGARVGVLRLRGNIERLMDRLEEAILILDPEGHLLSASRMAEHFLGVSRQALAGKPREELFPPASPLGGLLEEALQNAQPVRDAPVVLERGAAGPLRALVNIELLEALRDGTRSGAMITLRDAETRREIRSQLDVSTRLAAISRLTGGVAHEIKNPLNAIALHLEILKSRLADDATSHEELDVIGSEIARLDRVVKTFLDFTRPVEFHVQEVDLAELVRQLAALVRPGAEAAGVAVELHNAGQSALVRGDPDLLKQAILNVMSNGIEAMSAGGRLLLDVARDRDEVIVTIADQGPGIPADVRDKIFNLYFSTKKKGSGIGLAMTYRVVQLHGATIDFLTRRGQGTVFYLRFPAAGLEGTEEA